MNNLPQLMTRWRKLKSNENNFFLSSIVRRNCLTKYDWYERFHKISQKIGISRLKMNVKILNSRSHGARERKEYAWLGELSALTASLNVSATRCRLSNAGSPLPFSHSSALGSPHRVLKILF